MHDASGYMVLHVDLFVESMARSLNFYRDCMGFSVIDETRVRGPIVHSISNGAYDEARLVLLRSSPLGAMIELLELQRDSARSTHAPSKALPIGSVSLLVKDLDAHMTRAASLDWHPTSDVFTVDLPQRGRCRLVFYEDPDGNRLEFIEPPPKQGVEEQT